MAKKRDPLDASDSRARLERAALKLCRTSEPRHVRIEALGTLLSAYALGSRTAKRGLEEYQRITPGWNLPDKDEAMTAANDAFREAESLKVMHKAGDTQPGF